MIHADLRGRLRALARTPLLLVATDYDGTLAQIVADPASAAPCARALGALRALGEIRWTRIAVVSGRSIQDLQTFLRPHPRELLIGSHGAEWGAPGVNLTDEQHQSLGQLSRDVSQLAQAGDGHVCELKPAGVALHFRNASEEAAAHIVSAAIEKCGNLPGVRTRYGSKVVEFMVVGTSKGEAIRRAKHKTGASAVLYIGDDQTDEDAFAVLTGDDLGIKVGEGESIAHYRIEGVEAVGQVLGELAALRSEWARTRDVVPLDQCAVLSDQRTMAVVTPGAKVSWLCLPRLDSAALFAELVADESAGCFVVEPVHGGKPIRCGYAGDSFTLVTEWPDLVVTDYLDSSGGRAFQKAGRTDLIRVIEGATPARIRFAPRLDFGRIPTRFRTKEQGLEIEGSHDPICLRSPGVAWTLSEEGVHQTAHATVNPAAGKVVLELRCGTMSFKAVEEEPVRRAGCLRSWSGWASSLRLPSASPEVVKRSALVLKALCYGPTGVIAAAATTSLPEQLGGSRNWDYRFCWPRDSAMAAAALIQLGNTGHAMRFLDWMLEVVERCESPDRIHPIYTVSGDHLPPEAELGHLPGFGQSKPVRIGNAAANQIQLDVFGPIVHLVAMLAERGCPISPGHWQLVRAMVRAVETRWMEPDHGIWEMRLERRHHLHSKVMCWHTVSRALVVEEAMCGTRNEVWQQLRDSIHDDVLARGWSPHLNAFSGAYEHDYADAGTLAIGLTGLLDRNDSRWAATVESVHRKLLDNGTVKRYQIDDGLPGEEGGWHLCTGWLIESLVSLGRLDEAKGLFAGLMRCVQGPGILTEQYDPVCGMAVGNLAQAYSHTAVINASVALDRAETTPETTQ